MLHVLFSVGEAEYALPATDVVQIESFTGATRVPGAAPYVAGLVQVRGRVVPVIDLRARFGLPPIERALDARVMVVRAREREVALLVDRAREVIELAPDGFRPPPQIVSDQASGFVAAVAQARDRIVMLIDFDQVIGSAPLPEQETPRAVQAL
jgi:purine-binding chemotaxis protein CheW